MNPECRSLLTLFAYCLPQAHITVIISAHQYQLNLFIAEERITHLIVFSRTFPFSEKQGSHWAEAFDLVALIAQSPVALRFDIKDEMGRCSFISRAMALA